MDLFEQKAVQIIPRLEKDFVLTPMHAAAILGNIGHETGGFKYMQELHPVAGRGGLGWCQWTGPRRRAYEAWCADKRLDPLSDEANYGFLVNELRTTERGAIPALKTTKTLRDAVVAFESHFERAGVKAYDSRTAYAERALKAVQAVPPPTIPSLPPDVPPVPEPPLGQGTGIIAALIRLFAAIFGKKG